MQNEKPYYFPKELKLKIYNSAYAENNLKPSPKEISKILRELNNDRFLQNINKKKSIKNQFPQIRLDEKEHGGYPSMYITHPDIKEFMKVFDDERNLNIINDKLLKYGDLRNFYKIMIESFFNFLINYSSELKKIIEMESKILGVNMKIQIENDELNLLSDSTFNTVKNNFSNLTIGERNYFIDQFLNEMITKPNPLIFLPLLLNEYSEIN